METRMPLFPRSPARVVRDVAALSAVACLFAVLALGGCADFLLAQGRVPVAPRGPYLGQKAPGLTPELFAPGFVSTGIFERDVAMTPDGREFYFSAGFRTITTIMVTRLRDGAWTAPEVASVATDPANTQHSPYVSPDGRFFFFSSNAPAEPAVPSLKGLTHARLGELNSSPRNGNSDIFWVDARIIQELRRTGR
jgi:hypothetical protein